MPASIDTLVALGYALSLGLLIGIERGWTTRDEAPGTRVAGFRTFGLLGLAGGIAGLLPAPVAAVGLFVAGAVLFAGYLRQSREADGLSATTTLAGLATLLLGTLATNGRATEALAAAATITLLLNMRDALHRWLRGLSEAEIRSGARLALITLVVYPLVPAGHMGPLEAWNPRQLWVVVVLVSGLSFLGYFAARRLGSTRGTLITALCGAIVSSTAVTVAFARRIGAGDPAARVLTGGIALASIVMYLRVLLLTTMLAPSALPSLSLLMLPALAAALVAAGLLLRRGASAADDGDGFELRNPLELKAALGLAALVAVTSLASRWTLAHFGDIGVAGVLAITGLADVDAAVLTLAGLPRGAISVETAGYVLAAAVLLNTLFKGVLTLIFAPGRAGVVAAAPLAASIAAAALPLPFVL